MKRAALAAGVIALFLAMLTGCAHKPTEAERMAKCLVWVADNHPTDKTRAEKLCVLMIADGKAFN